MSKISYIWVAEQTEPGLNEKQYAATNTNSAPAPLKSVRAGDGLVHASSVYGDWKLLGTAKGDHYTNDYGTFIELDTPAMEGAPVELPEVVRMNWYSAA